MIDDHNIPWFSAINIATILGYNNTTRAISANIDKQDKKTFDKLMQYNE